MEPVKYKTLVIVESPTKCRTIEKYLGPSYMCVACCGHLREISDGLAGIGIGGGGICVDNDTFKCEPKYTAITKKMHHIRKIKHAISECNGTVLLGTDADREGEAIAWHVCQLFNLPVATTPRITFREITPIALENAIRNPQFIDMNLVHAQQARQVLDLIIGYTTTPLLWAAASAASSAIAGVPGSGPKKRKSSACGGGGAGGGGGGGGGAVLSAGRCQTPALRLMYDRENAADAAATSPKYEYNCKAYFTSYNIAFSLLHPIELENISEFLQLYVDKSKAHHTISADTDNVTRVTQSPPEAFKTSTLQRAASSILRFSPSETMECAQLLYEKGFITYHRTDETRTSEVFREQAATYIARTWGANYMGTTMTIRASPDNNVSISAHEAIRPVHVALSADKAAVLHRCELGANETRLYHLIWSRAVQSCMSEATCDKLVVRACNSDSEHVYAYNSYRPVSLGWRACVTVSAVSRGHQNTGNDDVDNMDNDDELCETFDSLTNKNRENPFHPEYKSYFDFFMNIRTGSMLPYNVIRCTTKLNRGAGCARYTESGMIRRLETLGIGRPSTFATILYKIQKREYIAKREIIRTVGTNFDCVNYTIDANGIVKAVGPKLVSDYADADTDAYVFGTERNKLQITNVGRMVVDTLMQKCAPVFAYDYTRRMEEELDAVAAGTREWRDVCRECYDTITRCIATTTTTTTTTIVDANTQDVGAGAGILRVINKYASVRDGKYGAYIFYKPPKLTKPKFISLKGFPHNALKCEISVISEWIEDHQ